MATTLIPSEHAEQIAFVQWFRLQFPSVRIIAIPNGGARNRVVAMKLKAEGVSAGVPDLHVPAWHLWIEMKRKHGGRLSPVQVDWISYLTDCGDTVIVGRGAEDAIRQVNAWHDSEAAASRLRGAAPGALARG